MKSAIEERANLPLTPPIQIHLAKRSEAENFVKMAGEHIIKLR